MRLGIVLLVLAGAATAGAATLQVGPGRTYAAPCAAIAAAADGDVIEIDAGTYTADVCAVVPDNLTLRGMGGFAHLAAGGADAEGKAIWVIKGNDVTVENIEFSGCAVPDQNGAGIRAEGTNLTIANCWFHDNEDGILGGAGIVSISGSEFGHNGYGDGYSHNMYLGNNVTRFTLQYCYSHHARIGHEVKSRAQTNFILYNRLMNEADGTGSYTIDLPNGGTSYVIGNLIQQGPATDNSGIFSYAAEGATNPGTDLYVVHNTFVNDLDRGTFIRNATSTAAVVVNNIFLGPGTVLDGPGDTTNNLVTTDAGLADRLGFDYHLVAGSAAIDTGIDPGLGAGFLLTPVFEYVHPTRSAPRTTVGAAIDRGAYEFGTPDADADADADVPADSSDEAGAESEADADADSDVPDGDQGGGCGCAVAGQDRHWPTIWLLAVGYWLLAGNRRTRKRD